jgi:hypothetical protein
VDSLETLLIYNEQNTVASFARSVVGSSAHFGLKSAVISIRGENVSFINKIKPFFDKVLEVS